MKRKLILTHSKPSQLRIQQTITSTSITTPPHFKKTLVGQVTSVSLQHWLFPRPSQVSLLVPKLPHPQPSWRVVVLLCDPLAAARKAMEARFWVPVMLVVLAPHQHHRFQSPWVQAPDMCGAVDLVYVWEILGLRVHKNSEDFDKNSGDLD